MITVTCENPGKLLVAALSVVLGIAALTARAHAKPSSNSSRRSVTSSLAALQFGNKEPTRPKVPFGNQPCQSLSVADLQSLKMSSSPPGKPDRAPATLPFDNLCFYGRMHLGYMTQIDYDSNKEGNRSSSYTAPADLPGAFYDKQGGLWFTKNGYYVVVSGSHDVDEKLARAIAAKL
jgi:hypothetical protein